MLLAARVVQGAFAAMMVPQMLSSVQVLYAPRERAAVFGVVGAVSGTAAVIGPAARRLAGHQRRVRDRLAQHLPDQLPVGLVMFVLAAMFVPEHDIGAAAADRPARRAAGQRSALFLLVYPLIEGQPAGLAGVDLGDARSRGVGCWRCSWCRSVDRAA